MNRKHAFLFSGTLIFAVSILWLSSLIDKRNANPTRHAIPPKTSSVASNEMHVAAEAYGKKDYDAAFKNFYSAAERGVIKAQSIVGAMYCYGHGVPRNYSEGAKWCRKAAEQGDAAAQYNLGLIYNTGEGVSIDYSAKNDHGAKPSPDYVQAAKWFRKAAEQGNMHAQTSLGLLYENGNGVPQDNAEAAKWFLKAAEQGDAVVQYNLALMYYEGRGVPKDYGEAAKWYRKASEQGLAAAQFMVGLMYDKGRGVPEDHVEAVKWYLKAAEQDYANAQNNLAVAYLRGEGVSRNYREAAQWYSKAAGHGVKEAIGWARHREWTTSELATVFLGMSQDEIYSAFGKPDHFKWASWRMPSGYSSADQSKMAFRIIYEDMNITNLDLGRKQSVLCIWFFYREGYRALELKTLGSSALWDLRWTEMGMADPKCIF